jgi:hypothetical protein
MVKFTYTEKGKAIPDYKAVQVVLYHYNKKKDLEFSNEIVIYAARVLMAKGSIDPNKVEFFDGDKPLGKVNSNFQFESYIKDSYYDEYLDYLFKIVFYNKPRLGK